MSLGYFGHVPGDGGALSSAIPFTSGSLYSPNRYAGWLKFALNNKILYVAKRPFRINLAYNVTVPNKIITINDRNYRVRTLDYDRPDNQMWTGGGTNEPPVLYNCEWNQLMYRVGKPYANPTKILSNEGIPFAQWASFSNEEIANIAYTSTGAYSLIRKLSNGNGAARLSLIQASTGTWSGTISINPGAIAWRPVLEYIP